MPVVSLEFSNVGPFDTIQLGFDEQINVLTGPNNSGKSTILWVLAELLVYPFTMPEKLLRSGDSIWQLDWRATKHSDCETGSFPSEVSFLENMLAEIGYTCFVPAQRSSTEFRSQGPTTDTDIESRIEEEINALLRARPHLRQVPGIEILRNAQRDVWRSESPILKKRRQLLLSDVSLVSDENVIQKIVNLDYASYRERRPEKRAIVETLATIVSEITEGYPVRFVGVREDTAGLIPEFETPDGIFPLNVLSQGTQSLLQWLARFILDYGEFYDFPPDLSDKPSILLLDEIDAHLHPSWQRRIIPTLTRNFPNIQIVCSTHSPLMLAGLDLGQVQLLRRSEDGNITVSTNESDIEGWTSDEILRNYFNFYGPADWSTANRLGRLQELVMIRGRSTSEEEEYQNLRNELGNMLGRDIPNGSRGGFGNALD